MNPALLALILTQAQTGCLNSAYNAGEIYGFAKTFRAVVLIESSACVNERGDDGRSLGPSQIQVGTVRKVCNCSVSADHLSKDRIFNLRQGAAFLEACFAEFWPDKRRAILCYNVGIPEASKVTDNQVKKSRYVARVLKALSELAHVRQTEG